MTTWIERTARQKAVSTVVLFCVVTAIVVWIYAENSAYVKVFFKGPPAATAADLDAAQNADSSNQPIATPYVTITGDKVLNTGVQEVTTYDGVIKNVSAGYYALQVGDRILIVKSAQDAFDYGERGAGIDALRLEVEPVSAGHGRSRRGGVLSRCCWIRTTANRDTWELSGRCWWRRSSGSSPGGRGGGSRGRSSIGPWLAPRRGATWG